MSAARNRGVREARGKHVAFLDADDEWEPGFLACIDGLIRKYGECGVFATCYSIRRPDAFYEARVKGLPFDSEDGVIDNYFEMCMKGHSPLWTSAVVASREAMLSVGGFPPLESGEDLLTWARLACRHKIAYSRKSLSTFMHLPESHKNSPARVYPPPKRDEGGRMLSALLTQYPHVKKLGAYVRLWHKIRLVGFVNAGKRRWALQEWLRTLPWGLGNLDCYYRLFLNFMPVRWHGKIKKWVGKY